jgi:tetratricopeptide (TPR) repeat protein
LRHGESLAIAKAMGFKPVTVSALSSLSWTYYCAGDYIRAKRAGQEGMALAKELGDSVEVAYPAENLGFAHLGLGEYQEARRCLLAAMRVYSQHKLRPSILNCLSGIARIWATEGLPEQALALLGLVMNHPSANWENIELAQAALEELRAELPSEMVEAALARGRTLDLEAVVAHLLDEAEDLH